METSIIERCGSQFCGFLFKRGLGVLSDSRHIRDYTVVLRVVARYIIIIIIIMACLEGAGAIHIDGST